MGRSVKVRARHRGNHSAPNRNNPRYCERIKMELSNVIPFPVRSDKVICSRCGKKLKEGKDGYYTIWGECRECGQLVCKKCSDAPGEYRCHNCHRVSATCETYLPF